MYIFKTKNELQAHLQSIRNTKETIGFVPTMGALHAGHLSLIAQSKSNCNLTICSIFVNPTQFNDPKDFENYPSTIDADISLLQQHACDILFLPSVSEMYPNGFQENKSYELGELESLWEGAHRPGHFQGVCQVVDKLLNLVQPHVLFLGEKDFQQVAVLKKMISQSTELRNIQVLTGKTIREKDGLAMSSRNMRLSPEERQQATAIFKGFKELEKQWKNGQINAEALTQPFSETLFQNNFHKIDYIACVNPDSLQAQETIQLPSVVIVAAFIGNVRLIDNFSLQ